MGRFVIEDSFIELVNKYLGGSQQMFFLDINNKEVSFE
jgi:hypothetical protein